MRESPSGALRRDCRAMSACPLRRDCNKFLAHSAMMATPLPVVAHASTFNP
ncbi:hypothetical protein MYA_3070 [Burkholderia sp. KJ006]|nr:hypothetical protein MYA_3070 [Burkholderia sp. KJ006]